MVRISTDIQESELTTCSNGVVVGTGLVHSEIHMVFKRRCTTAVSEFALSQLQVLQKPRKCAQALALRRYVRRERRGAEGSVGAARRRELLSSLGYEMRRLLVRSMLRGNPRKMYPSTRCAASRCRNPLIRATSAAAVRPGQPPAP